MGKGTFSHWSRTFLLLEEDFFSSWTFSVRVGLFCVRVGLFSIGGGLFSIGGGLFPSPPVTEKSPPPTRKSPTAIPKRCWTLEYSGELEFSSPFMEQWTLDARGVLWNISVNLSSQVHLWSSGLWMLEEYYLWGTSLKYSWIQKCIAKKY